MQPTSAAAPRLTRTLPWRFYHDPAKPVALLLADLGVTRPHSPNAMGRCLNVLDTLRGRPALPERGPLPDG